MFLWESCTTTMEITAKTSTVPHTNPNHHANLAKETNYLCLELEGHIGLGSSGSVAVGRVSYCFVSNLPTESHKE